MEKWHKQHNEVVEVGGLYIIGTERHESRRIDNQLRGRAGRQGDPGNSRFYLSLDDSLLRIFGGDTMRILMKKLGMQAGESIENRLLSRSIETAQRKVEAHHFDIRKQLLEYDDVANEQRKIIYTERQVVLMASSLDNMINDMIDFSIVQVIENAHAAQLTTAQLDAILLQDYQLTVTSGKQTNLEIVHIAQTAYLAKLQAFHSNNIYHTVNSTQFARNIILEHLDEHWREYLTQLEHLRQGIGLRSYAQKNPKQEYKQESFSLFKRMLDQVKINITKAILTMEFMQETVAPEDRSNTLQSRNAICYCGSGNKYKHCHGKLSINS
jgi:preprotein translocase subunit SecA